MKFSSYYYLSLIAMLSMVYYAYYTHRQFYPTLLFLVSSKIAYVVAGNMVLASAFVVSRIFKNIYFGQLRDVEVELLVEKAKYIFVETCFALTMFRNEINTPVMALFITLIFVKLIHKLSKSRLEYLEQVMPVPVSTQVRMGFLLGSLISVDIFVSYLSLMYILKNGRSVLILFGFEFALLLIYAFNLIVRFTIQVIDSRLTSGLTSRGLYLMLTDLMCDVIKLVTYLAFFCLVFVYYGLPIYIIRDVYSAYLSFHRKLVGFIKYLKLARNLDSRFPDASTEEMTAAGSCLVCRDEMTSAKKLPCGHVFHMDCLRMWLQHQQTCPLCKSEIPTTTSTEPTVDAAAAAAAAGPDAVPVAAGVVPPVPAEGGNVAAPVVLPQDVHATPQSIPVSSSATASVKVAPTLPPSQEQFPAFYVVLGEPDMAILSDPSRQGKQLRRVDKGTILFISLRVTDVDGTQWLRTPDGWILEKLEVVMCGACESQRSAEGVLPVCTHSTMFLRPLLNNKPTTTTTADSSSSSSASAAVSANTESGVAPLTSLSSSDNGSARVYNRQAMKDRWLSNEANTQRGTTEVVNSKAPLSNVLDDKETFQRTVDGSASRFEQMLVLQNQIESLTKTLIEANKSLLVCQQSLSQLIREEIKDAHSKDNSTKGHND